MKTWRERRIEQTIQRHDPKLFLNKNYLGELQIMRRSFHMVPYDIDGKTIQVLTPNPHYIMSLTEDWTSRTRPVDYGLDPIMRRLQEIDEWNRGSAFDRMKKQHEEANERKRKAFASLSEDVAKEWRKDFSKKTADILTHSVDKKDPRQKGDRKYGYR